MSKRCRVWNQNSYEKRIKQGRGSGECGTYSPWITVQNFSSRGSVSRLRGWKTNRVHHFMSNNELLYFYLLEWSDEVIDIREQYPLLDVFATIEIAKSAGIMHPYDRKSGFPYVLTTDFLITTKNGLKARTIKESHELDNSRVLEKLEIERRYWNERNVDWRVVTEREINRTKAKNVEWLHTAKMLSGLPYDDVLMQSIVSEIIRVYRETQRPILGICDHIDQIFATHPGTGLAVFKYLVANKHVSLDINKPLVLTDWREVDIAIAVGAEGVTENWRATV